MTDLNVKELLAVIGVVVSAVTAHFTARMAASKEVSDLGKEVADIRVAMQTISSSLALVESLLSRIESNSKENSDEVRDLLVKLAELRVRIRHIEEKTNV